MPYRLAAFAAIAFALLFAVPAARAVEPPKIEKDARNPPPKVPLNTFQRFELAPVAMGAPFTEHETNTVARAKLEENFAERVKPLLAEWNARPAGDAPRTLRIEPEIAYVRFITGGKRFWGGAFAGDSIIHVRVRMRDAASGETIAEPQFYQHANAFGAAWSFGGTDKHMLIRLSGMLEHSLRSNYEAAVGGAVAVAPGHED